MIYLSNLVKKGNLHIRELEVMIWRPAEVIGGLDTHERPLELASRLGYVTNAMLFWHLDEALMVRLEVPMYLSLLLAYVGIFGTALPEEVLGVTNGTAPKSHQPDEVE